ncbi:SusC/RagA family TonB-linked outer membrane protein [Longitalea luteola]|uniref:SusC/RagA family TonB-linked outer membrane protein n=1 Tax=Longitalea luteola TaxID=2812563 RepID=UPI001A958A1D|nr:SusC/RagA family TonB-linked outer membrane protein [Longitalea luteola]
MRSTIKKRRSGIFLLPVVVLLFLQATAFAQEMAEVSGTVLTEKGEVLPAVSVMAMSRTGNPRQKVSAFTNDKGVFTFPQLTIGEVYDLTFSSVGYATSNYKGFTVKQAGRANTLLIRLKSKTDDLDEVVVTSLGIKREERTLGYAVTRIDGEELTNAMSNNWSDALTGKVAGLNIIKSGGGPAGSSKIILRGGNSFYDPDNAALIVVDGVVISGSSGKLTGTGSGNYLDADSPVDFGSSLADLNPEDIESVSVLKGPNATALYGSRGGNGAIIITTKQGASKQKGWGLNLNSNAAIATINRWPDYQYEYGQGDRAADGDLYYSYGDSEDGLRTYSSSSAWGPKFDGQLYYQYEPERYRLTAIPAGVATKTPWVPYRNNRKDFFETAKTITNTISLAGGNDRTSARLSYTNVYNSWIVPNTGYKRNTVALQLNHKVNDRLSISAKINYNNRTSDNLPSTGYNNQTIMYFIRGITPSMDLNWFKDYWIPGKEGMEQRRPFSLQLDNPFLQAYEMLNTSNRNGVIGNVTANYNFTRKLSLMLRTSVDMMMEDRSQRKPKSTQKYADGMYREQDIVTSEINSDFLLRYDAQRRKSLFNYNVAVGGSLMKNRYRRNEYRAEKLIFPNIFTLANSALPIESRPYRAEYAVNGLYGMATVSYKDFLYLDLTARQDWTSTLVNPVFKKVPDIFYPSVNLSAVLSDAVKLPQAISFLKLRASWAEVGSGGTRPYLTAYTYNTNASYPGGLYNPTVIPNEELKPLRTRSIELGTDIRFLKNRIQLDVAVYQNNTKDQIIDAPVDVASGYALMIMNAGEVRNRGLEVMARADVLKLKKFTWSTYGNFSTNRNKIISIPGDRKVLMNMVASRVVVEAFKGGSLGDMYGLGYLRSPEGEIVYRNGLPVRSDSLMYLGNSMAKYKFGWGNQLRYGQFSFSFLFDGQAGGKAYSLTHAVLAEEGKLKKTLPGRYNGITGDGVMETADGKYVKNTVVATNVGDFYAEHFNRDNAEANMFSTDFIKLRELRLDYSIAPALVKRLKLQKLTIGVYGRDLLVITDWPAFDPEFGALDDGDIRAGAEVAQFPSTRSMGINLNVSF